MSLKNINRILISYGQNYISTNYYYYYRLFFSPAEGFKSGVVIFERRSFINKLWLRKAILTDFKGSFCKFHLGTFSNSKKTTNNCRLLPTPIFQPYTVLYYNKKPSEKKNYSETRNTI